MKKIKFRQLHRQIAPFIVLPLFITAMTGVCYRLGKSWFGLSRDQVHFLMVIHEGEYLGHQLEPFYVLLNFLGVMFMLITGTVMLFKSIKNINWLFWKRAEEKKSSEI